MCLIWFSNFYIIFERVLIDMIPESIFNMLDGGDILIIKDRGQDFYVGEIEYVKYYGVGKKILMIKEDRYQPIKEYDYYSLADSIHIALKRNENSDTYCMIYGFKY